LEQRAGGVSAEVRNGEVKCSAAQRSAVETGGTGVEGIRKG